MCNLSEIVENEGAKAGALALKYFLSHPTATAEDVAKKIGCNIEIVKEIKKMATE